MEPRLHYSKEHLSNNNCCWFSCFFFLLLLLFFARQCSYFNVIIFDLSLLSIFHIKVFPLVRTVSFLHKYVYGNIFFNWFNFFTFTVFFIKIVHLLNIHSRIRIKFICFLSKGMSRYGKKRVTMAYHSLPQFVETFEWLPYLPTPSDLQTLVGKNFLG